MIRASDAQVGHGEQRIRLSRGMAPAYFARDEMHWRGLLTLALVLAALVTTPIVTSGCQTPTEPEPLRGQVQLTLLHTSDLHSRLFPYNLLIGHIDDQLGLGTIADIADVGGVARISHIVGRERARSHRVLHMDGGDCFQGAPIFNFFSGEAEIRTLSAMGVDGMIVANHEFDKGAQNLGIQLQQWANFPVMVANYKLEDPSQPGASPLGQMIQPFQTYDLDGLKVSVIGMGNLSSLSSIYEQPNRLGVVPMSTVEVAQFYIDLLRPISDVIVFVTHLGLNSDQEMIEHTSGIDIVLGGHNHIVLQPPKKVRDCQLKDENGDHYIETVSPEPQDPSKPSKLVRRYCKPRDVVLAHSGAFAKYVGRLDVVLSDEPGDFPASRNYAPVNGFEVASFKFRLFPVNANVPEDPIVRQVLEPYGQGLDLVANLELLVGYAPTASRRSALGDSPLGNLIATAMWLRQGVQTDFSLTNTTGIRADIVPGPVDVEQMYNIFPFDNSISKMQLSGFEVKELFDFVARRSAGRGCKSQVQIAGARIVLDCTAKSPNAEDVLGAAKKIYIGTVDPKVSCTQDSDCPGQDEGACDGSLCWQPINPIASYELATSNYLAGGGSGFAVLKRNTTQFDTKIQQRDALIDYIRAGRPCGSNALGNLTSCAVDSDCAGVGEGFVCSCRENAVEGPTCGSDDQQACNKVEGAPGPTDGACVLARCRQDVAGYQRSVCERAPTAEAEADCLASLAPCATGGEQCKFLACIDASLGSATDGRVEMLSK
jgi:5'-nucleotidase / UDP-sugar diphosphatase